MNILEFREKINSVKSCDTYIIGVILDNEFKDRDKEDSCYKNPTAMLEILRDKFMLRMDKRDKIIYNLKKCKSYQQVTDYIMDINFAESREFGIDISNLISNRCNEISEEITKKNSFWNRFKRFIKRLLYITTSYEEDL